MQKQQSVSLKNFSALKIGGTAGTVYFPESVAELTGLLAENPHIPVIGGGTNVFFGDLPELICTRRLNKIAETAAGVEAECGARLEKLFDFAAGVPATVGGGVHMNFGAFGLELKDFLASARIWNAGKICVLPAAKLRLGYRSSGFSGVVLAALFRQKHLDSRAEYLKQRREKMPLGSPNIGSIFLNPPGQSAGALIENAGLKGYKFKNLQVSEKHANVIVNNGAASAADLLFLLEHIKQTVQNKCSVELTPEIQYIG
jgi:UDP-N-acetylmuramate dehydrogenase